MRSVLNMSADYKGYTIYEDGTVMNSQRTLLRGTINANGYRLVGINGTQERVHRILAYLFIPNPNNYPCINHIDGDKLNNSLDNLEWCTHSHNNKHAYDTGLKEAKSGEDNILAKFTNEQVVAIREAHERAVYGYVTRKCKELGISRTNYYKLVNGDSYRKA